MSSISRRQFVSAVGVASIATARAYSAVVGANDRLRIGVIGTGGQATSHMKALVKMRDSDNVEIINVCDVYQKRLDEAAQLTSAKPLPDYRRLLDNKDIDYVLIATPEHWHYQMGIDALDAGKHVYIEKPMTHRIEQAQKLVAKVETSGKKLQVGVQGMSDESYAEAYKHVKAGELGRIVLAQIDYSRNYKDDFWAGDDYPIDAEAKPGVNLDWKAWLGPAPKREWDPERYFRWRRYWDYSGGIATDLFVHRATRLIKALNLTFPEYVVGTGGKFEYVNSVAEIPDTFNVLADYPGGPTMQLISSMGNDARVDHMIRGHKATLYFTRTGFEIKPQEGDEQTPVYTYEKKGAEDLTLHHRNLQNAIRKNEPLNCDCQLGLAGVVVCEMAVESYRKREYLKWDAAKARVVKA
ncbi:MAG TPA: Gfo/Idh/MocA family oxidoreductase [Bryobacteraceae bacterium]|nr:Gfo/Idh/MocA family oxidoreductase [Bryobacteraceae bacterium]